MRNWLPIYLCLAATTIQPSPGQGATTTPHPAVVRIVAPEDDGTAYGSGTLIDVRDKYGLVLTNWHVVCDATGPLEVIFPSGFISQSRPIKMDSDWDLAALVIWKPNCEPVKLAAKPPRPGDVLTICGYGSGNYRAVSGRCTQFYAPRLHLPQELVELDVQARQGDSGGPIFNDRGELAGVLFGAGQGTTLGSFEGRVKTFLASLAPDIGQPGSAPQIALRPSVKNCPTCQSQPSGFACQGGFCSPQGDLGGVCFGCDRVAERETSTNEPRNEESHKRSDWPEFSPRNEWDTSEDKVSSTEPWPRFKPDTKNVADQTNEMPPVSPPIVSASSFESIRNVLAFVGVAAIVLQVIRLAS